MSLLFHPTTLEILKNFKINPTIQDLITLVPLILDNTCFLDFEYLHFILFSNCALSINELENMKKGMRRVIEKCFVKVETRTVQDHYSEELTNKNRHLEPGKNYLCLLKTLKNYEYSDLLVENRRSMPVIVGNVQNANLILDLMYADQKTKNKSKDPKSVPNENNSSLISSQSNSVDMSFFSLPKKTKKGPTQSNTLNFAKAKELPHQPHKKFAPLDLGKSHFVYNRNAVKLETQRKRDDLVNPVQLQFIKFCDQTRPPIYQKRGELARSTVSCVKMPEVISYDDSSSEDWASVDETAESEIEESSKSSDENNEEEWIEKDSDDVEITKFSKKPSFLFKQVNVETYFDLSKYLRCPLFETSEFPGYLKDELLKSCEGRHASKQEIIESFSREYLIDIRAVKEELDKYL